MSGCLDGADARGWVGRYSELNHKYPCSLSDIFDKWNNNVIFFLEKQTIILFLFRPQYLRKENTGREISVSLTWNGGCFPLSQFSVFSLIPCKGDRLKVCLLGYALKQYKRWWEGWATSDIESPLWSFTLTLNLVSETLCHFLFFHLYSWGSCKKQVRKFMQNT